MAGSLATGADEDAVSTAAEVVLFGGLILYSFTTGLDVSNVRSCSLTLDVFRVVLFPSSRFEELVDDEREGEVAKCEIGFVGCKFRLKGLLSLIRLRGSCMAVSSSMFAEDVAVDASAISVKFEFAFRTFEGADVDNWLVTE